MNKKIFLRTWFVIAGITTLLSLGIWLRLMNLNNVPSRSPDERTYTHQANIFLKRGNAGLKGLAEEYQCDPNVRLYPPPTRVGYLWLLAATMKLTGIRDASAGAYLSCAASIGSLLVLTLAGLRFFPLWATLIALLFFAVSPAELALSRRAWGDALVGFLSFSMVWSAAEITSNSRRYIWYFIFIVLGCLGIVMKESGPVAFGLCMAWLLWVLIIERREWKNGLAMILGSLMGTALCISWIAVTTGGYSELLRMLANWIRANATSAYTIEYQSGPGHRLLQCFWIVTPFSVLMFLIGLSVVLLSNRKLKLWHMPAEAADWQVVNGIVLFVLSYLTLPMLLPHWLNLRLMSPMFGPFYLIAGLGFWYCGFAGWSRLKTSRRKVVAGFAIVTVAIGAIADYRFFEKVVVQNDLPDLAVKWLIDLKKQATPVRVNRVAIPNPAELAAAEALAKLAPSPENYLNLSLRYIQNKRHEESITASREALKIKPDYAEAYNNIAAAYEAMGRWDEAIQAAEQALKIQPDFQFARNNLQWALSQKRKEDSSGDR